MSHRVQKLTNFSGEVLLPAVSYIPSNPAIVLETWEIIKHFTYDRRCVDVDVYVEVD